MDQTKFGSTKLGQALGVLLSIIAAWCLATAAVYSRKLKNIPAKVVLFYHGVIGMIAAGVYWIVEAIVNAAILFILVCFLFSITSNQDDVLL